MNEQEEEVEIAPERFAEFISQLDPTVRFAAVPPEVRSFREFLETYAMVRGEDGGYEKFTFEGRELLIAIADTVDLVVGLPKRV